MSLNCGSEYRALVDEWVPEDGRYDGYKILKPGDFCKESRRAFILRDGTLVSCKYDIRRNYGLGNVFKEGFFSVWNRDETRKCKEAVKHKQLGICEHCPQSEFYKNKIVLWRRYMC